ncbi:1616_t:CDS:2 [Gigaspora margarita]|uniref:1616_t:CDS:1 n=1 Tax=Gigaspora margarita TaxID=4874 RepID=A0ABN7VLT1_GIGMA|nr:1616_t:CDS:2 [Gigaspora margarita]
MTSKNETDKNVNVENDIIDVIIKFKESKPYRRLPRKIKLNEVRTKLLRNENDSNHDFNMGSNCRFLYFLKNKAEIRPSDESELNLLDIVEKNNGNHYLYISQNAEFDLTQLRFEKGLRINKDGSITNASDQAFEINFDGIKVENINQQYGGVHECNHETTVECKRSLIFDVKFSAGSEWISTSIGLSHENSGQTLKQRMTYTKHSYERLERGIIKLDKNITAVKNFIDDVKNIVNNTIQDNDKISKLCEISEKYGHFYAKRLILGGTIIRNEEYTKNSVENSKSKATNAQVGVGIATNIFNPEINVTHSNKDMHNNYNNDTNHVETSIGGEGYSQDDKHSWRQSLNDATKWKIIGYKDVYPLFELLDDELKKKVLNVVGHQILKAKVDEITFNIRDYEKRKKKPYIHKLSSINKIKNIGECNILASIVSEKNNIFSLHVDYMGGNKNRPVIVIHHIHGEKTMKSYIVKEVKEVKIKIGWIIIGPPTSFDFSIRYPLIFKSGKYQPLKEKDRSIISNCGMFGTCVLEATNITPQIKNSSDTGTATYNQITYDPKNSPFAIGNYITRSQESICQESAWLFVYDIKTKKKVTDEEVLKRLSLYSCIVDATNSRQLNDFFGEMKFNWIKGKNKEILYSSEEIKISKNNLVLVNQIFDHEDCKNCQPLGFVNIISDKIYYGSLNSKQLDIDENDGSIVYLSIPLDSTDKM